ncbi:hypothetical protein StoSoilB5_11390 [Arthrobacter sp. StoSoilB5]|nr:hypothetical protein StoSoilB5_11390 [Arthrobacter sp. StoSoilB5]
MEYVFRGGLAIPGRFRIIGPWVILSMSPSQLEFRLRSRWLARYFGPWRLQRSAVRDIYPGRPHVLYSWTRINFLADDNMPWMFLAEWPEGVLGAAKELGYPARFDTRIWPPASPG